MSFITIENNEEHLIEFLNVALIQHRDFYKKWSAITHQTATIKSGYLSQHLASLITGVRGGFTGARGDDLKDGTEVKACTRIDQLDRCQKCKAPVSRVQDYCLTCGSYSIERKNDSKWLFSVKNEEDLDLLLNRVPRILLILFDYPNFKKNDFSIVDVQAFEIYPKIERYQNFKHIMTNYYNNIYLIQKTINLNKSPAPKNFWPDSYQFYLCNPVKIFHARIEETVNILHYVQPDFPRENIVPVPMPSSLLTVEEKKLIDITIDCSNIDEFQRLKLPLREDRAFTLHTKHARKSLL